MKKKVPSFWLQPTKTFPEGAPQREEYTSDGAFYSACSLYGVQWRQEYECEDKDCQNRDCPQHHPEYMHPK